MLRHGFDRVKKLIDSNNKPIRPQDLNFMANAQSPLRQSESSATAMSLNSVGTLPAIVKN